MEDTSLGTLPSGDKKENSSEEKKNIKLKDTLKRKMANCKFPFICLCQACAVSQRGDEGMRRLSQFSNSRHMQGCAGAQRGTNN